MTDVTEAVTLSAAFMVGIAGSAHCVLMCGGFAGALGMRSRTIASADSAWRDASLYNIGRLSGYAAAGATFGLFGATLQSAVNLPLLATTARLAAGLLVIFAAVRILFGLNALAWIERLGARLWRLLQPIARQAATSRSPGRSLLLGLLWGWMPCGLVYSVLLLAALSGSTARGAGLMLAFGLGTMPAMLTSSALAAHVSAWTRRRAARQLGGALLLLFGLWMAWAAIPSSHHHDAQLHPVVERSELLREAPQSAVMGARL
jgi:sulfite exporter TauE/SafE